MSRSFCSLHAQSRAASAADGSTIQAIEMQAKDREFIESAAPMLVSSDGVEIEGLERDLLASGRYVGQLVALSVEGWAETYGGSVQRDGSILRLRGNDELADHIQALVRIGERSTVEVQSLGSQLRSEQDLVVSLSPRALPDLRSATSDCDASVDPRSGQDAGHRHGRFTLLQMSAASAGVSPGHYLTLLAVVHWNGVRPIHEVWSSAIELATLSDAGENTGVADSPRNWPRRRTRRGRFETIHISARLLIWQR